MKTRLHHLLLLGLAVAGTTAQAAITDNLIGYWDFNDGSGSVLTDRSAYGNNGMLSNAPTWTSGLLGGALNFVSTSAQYVVVTNYPKPSSQMTIAAWVRANSRPQWASIAKNWGGGAEQFHFSLYDTAGDLEIHMEESDNGNPFVREGSGSPLPTNGWQHVAYVCDGAGLIRLYRNGIQVSSAAYDNTIRSAPALPSFAIGAKQNSATTADSFWNGLIDDLGMWNRGLSATEVRALYLAGINGLSLTNADTPLAANASVLADVGVFGFTGLLTTTNATSKGWYFGPATIPAGVTLNGVALKPNTTTNDPATGLTWTSIPRTYAISGYTWSGTDQQAARDNLTKGGVYDTTAFSMNLAATAGKTYAVEIVSFQNSGNRYMNVLVDGQTIVTNWTVIPPGAFNRLLRLRVVADTNGIDLAFSRGSTSDFNPAISIVSLTELPTVPVLLTQPAGADRWQGESVLFSGSAQAADPLSYQWYQDTTLLTGATNTSLTLTNLQTGNAGSYTLVASSAGGSVTSAPAVLTVAPVTAIPDALIAYWNFDDATGSTLADLSAFGNNGTLQNFPVDDSQWIAGQIGGALNFRGGPGLNTNDYVLVANYPKPSATMTISAWVWADARPTWATIVKNWPGVGSQFHFGLQDTAGDLSNYLLQQGGGQIGPVREGTIFPTNSWQHVVLVCDGASMRLYRNGVLVGAPLAYNGTIQTNPVNASLSIGAKAYGSVDGFWQGRMDDMAMWNRALMPDEIAGIYVAGLNGQAMPDAIPGAPPVINVAPVGGTRFEQEAIIFSVTAAGSEPRYYQWRQNGTDLPNATNRILTLTGLATTNGGDYTVVITNALGSVTSAPAALVVQAVTAIANGLAGYWSFDDATGSLLTDGSSFGNNGMLTNFPGDDSQWIAGQIGGGLRFDGANDYVIVTNYPKSSGPLTLAAWVWADARPGWATIAKNWPSAASHFHFGLTGADGDLSNYIRDGSGAEPSAREGVGKPIPLGRWQHVAFVCDGSTLRVYRNGVEVGSTNYNGTLNTNLALASFAIGAKLYPAGNGDSFWNGKMDDMGLWTRGLTTAEIQAIYLDGLQGAPLTNSAVDAVAPIVTLQPQGFTRYEREAAPGPLTVDAAGTGTLGYQWRKDGTNVGGATSNAFVLPSPLAAGDGGSYDVVITNETGSVTSAPAAVIVIPINFSTALAGYWTFDDGAGTNLLDHSGSASHGQLMNFPGDDSGWIPGQIGGALNFGGPVGQDYVIVTNYPKPTTTMTLAGWVWAESRSQWATIAKNWPAAGMMEFHFGLRDLAGNLNNYLNQANGAAVFADETGAFPLGSWHHVAFVCDGTMMRLYRNGSEVGSVPYNGTINTTGVLPPMGIGAKLGANGLAVTGADVGYWHGKMDDMGLWTRGLYSDEIMALYVSGTNGFGVGEAALTATAPAITLAPASQSNALAGTTVVFTAAATGAPAPLLQWQFNGANLPNETNTTLTLNNVQPGQAGAYRLVARNPGGTVWSDVAHLTVNRAPVALNDDAGTAVNVPILLDFNKLVGNDSDPDTDPLAVISVSNGTNGGTAQLTATNVIYTPPANVTGTDAFTYTISDGRGATAQATVVVRITNGQSQNITGWAYDSGSHTMTLNFAGIPGYIYRVQFTESLVVPISWTDFATNTAPPNGQFSVTDTNELSGSRFYRTVTP